MEVRFLALGMCLILFTPMLTSAWRGFLLFSSGDVMKKWKPVQFLELLSRKEPTPEQEGEGAWLVSGALSRMEVALGWA